MDEKLRFAVFIDFDNIEIGVKSTLHRDFDVDCVLEGIKERGEVAAKVAYGNWSRQSQATRALTEHGVQMVQRDSTPRGDKNGADINLALDALEMAFTRDHINAFAIVSGDSDFMALVNKLKQYNKRVYIVGGKAFTSTILQRNCHEFISYESLLDSQPVHSRGGQQAQRGRQRRVLPLSQCLPLLERALGALELRGVQPQMGLLKSTMLQLDPAFTERDYGSSTFSAFVGKLAKEHLVTIRTVDGHYVVDRKDRQEELETEAATGAEDALPFLKEVLESNVDLLAMGIPAREIRALVKAADAEFKETDYGFQQFNELLNFAADKRLIRIETDPHHGMRFYPGDDLRGTAAKPVRRLSAQEESRAVAGHEKPEPARTSEPAASPEWGAEHGRSRKKRPRRRSRSANGVARAGASLPSDRARSSAPDAPATSPPAEARAESDAGSAHEEGPEISEEARPRRLATRRRRTSSSQGREDASPEAAHDGETE